MEDEFLERIDEIQLADPREERDLPIEVLIGGEHYWRIVKYTPTIRLSLSLVLLPTKFGLILTGNRIGVAANQMEVNRLVWSSLIATCEGSGT